MQIEFRSRHFTLGDDQKEQIETQLEKLDRFSPRPLQSARVTITHESGRFSCDTVLYLKNHEFRSKGEGVEPELAIVEVVESLRKQLSKFKGKMSARQKGEEGGLGRALVDEKYAEGGIKPLESEGFLLEDMDVASAMSAFNDSKYPFLIFRNQETNKVSVVYKRDDGELSLMQAEDG